MGNFFDTEKVAIRERPAYWQEVVCDTFVQLDCRFSSRDDFHGRLQVSTLNDLQVVDVRASGQSVLRSPGKIARSESEFVLVSLALEGCSQIQQDGREARLDVGSFAIYDTRSPYELHFNGAFRQMVVQIPRARLQQRLGGLEYLTAMSLCRDRPLERLVFDFLAGLSGLEGLEQTRQAQLSEQALDLLVMALCERGSGQIPETTRCTALLFRLKAYIGANLSRSDLSLQEVAYQFGVTPRYVNSLLHQEGTSFGRYVLLSRLQRCAHDLRRPELSTRQVSEIAYRWGFNDMTHFSRVFKAQFGVPPRLYRCITEDSAF